MLHGRTWLAGFCLKPLPSRRPAGVCSADTSIRTEPDLWLGFGLPGVRREDRNFRKGHKRTSAGATAMAALGRHARIAVAHRAPIDHRIPDRRAVTVRLPRNHLGERAAGAKLLLCMRTAVGSLMRRTRFGTIKSDEDQLEVHMGTMLARRGFR